MLAICFFGGKQINNWFLTPSQPRWLGGGRGGGKDFGNVHILGKEANTEIYSSCF